MKIERAETVAYSLPFAAPYVTARGEIREREMVLLRLQTDAGFEGLGEAVPLALRGDKPIDVIEREVEDAARRITSLELTAALDDPLGFAVTTMVELRLARRVSPATSAALECAVFDVVAKAAGIPLWRLLGVEAPEPVTCNATLAAGEPDEVAAEAADWVREGFRHGEAEARLGRRRRPHRRSRPRGRGPRCEDPR